MKNFLVKCVENENVSVLDIGNSIYRAAGVAWHWDYSDGSLDTTVGAATKVTLFTGGKAVIGRWNLFCINCGAYRYGKPAGSSAAPWLDTPGTNMDVTSLTVLGKHPGSDGNVWIALPDNSEPDMTVTAPADHYSAGASPQKYTSYLTANGDNLDNKTPEFCVGQQVTFTLNGLPGFVDAVGHWSLPGKYVNEQYQYSSSCTSYRVNPDLLNITGQNLATHCWYVNQPGGTVGVNANLHFSNGQYASVTAMGKFSIFRPTLSNFNPLLNLFTWDSPVLHANMSWLLTVNSKYDGYVGTTQLINASGLLYYNTGGEFYLDGSEIYGESNTGLTLQYFVADPTTHTTRFLDTPRGTALPCVEMVATFNDYVRFMPNGGIWVTLGLVNWNMDGAACIITGQTRGIIPPASGPADTDAFPLWLHHL